ncbi:carbohydrate kinase family protein [Streptomyces deccanensis]|uniref:carbohydrate kinase family protein n=1 Tax=Streptomyces deccanensis TaxID=424188 RepID=UPI001EFAD042|nr:carbohydrate kinase family protein [Streptomyces deccanensis]ULR51514.1 carbohydrate kinase family protein [Streptomyces deccanensis]
MPRIVVSGSIATDHLMAFPGSFTDQLIADRLDRVSLSFLADSLHIRRGGVAANIAFGLASLGFAPVLVGAAGKDFAAYGDRLRTHSVDTASVWISENLHTARFVCTTDARQNQIATFYAGAMAEAREISLAAVVERHGVPGLVVVAANDPEAMLRHSDECRRASIPFAADPSQQLARLGREETRRLVEGARYLFTNEYEAALLMERTGWTREQVLRRTATWITTRGPAGVEIVTAEGPPLRVPAVPADETLDPTGVGDAFRAGYLAGISWRWPQARAARLGCALATVVLQTTGTQEYALTADALLDGVEQAYGPTEARAMARPLTTAVRPGDPAKVGG